MALSSAVLAQASQNQMVAEALFEDGQKLMAAGKTAEACEKFAASQKLDPAMGTLLNLAACHEKLGKTATAWAEFNDALAQATKQGDQPRVKFARSHADALEKQLFRIVIEVKKPNKNLVVKLDGVELVREGLGTAIPSDPGQHEVEATQPGRKPFRQTVNGAAGATERVEIPELPEIEYGMPHPDTQTQPPPEETPPPKEEPLTTTKKGGTNPMLIGGITALGVGVGGVVLGAIFGVTALGQASDRDKLCPPKTVCRNQAAFDDDYNARVSQTMMFVFGGAGVALVATGAVLVGMSFANKPKTGLWIQPSVSPRVAGLELGGSF